MKYLSIKPSLKLVFMTCITSILILPTALLAQNEGDVNIEFHGRDTMVNGVNMKYLPAKDRKAVRAQIAILNRISPSAKNKTADDPTDNNKLTANNNALHPATAAHDSVAHSETNKINTSAAVPAQTTASSAVAPATQSAAPSVNLPSSVPLTTTPLAAVTPAAIPPSVTPTSGSVPASSATVPASGTVPASSATIPASGTAPASMAAMPASGTAPASVTVPASIAAVPASVPPTIVPVPQNGGAQAAVTPVTQASTPAAVSAPVAAVAPVAPRELVRNSQTFEYSITSKEGISTHVTYYITEPAHSDAQQIIGAYKPGLEIQDVSLLPQFWAGKTLLTFSLPDKTPAEIVFTDSEGKPMWEDRIVSPNFSKSFSWTLNGTYYLVVKQGGETAIKKIVKE